MLKPKAHDSIAKNRERKNRRSVTDPPTQKNNETMQTQPCNKCLCKKELPNAQNLQILLPLTDEGFKVWGMLA